MMEIMQCWEHHGVGMDSRSVVLDAGGGTGW
jgi:hypothetical protein